MKMFLRATALVAVGVVLCACGGGGGGGGGPAATLSENQRLFEEASLSANGGTFVLGAGFFTEPPPRLFQMLISKFELGTSPLGVPGGVLGVYTPATDLIASSPTPANRSESSDNVGSAFVDNGQIRFIATKTPSRVTYEGANIVAEMSAPGGEVGSKTLISNLIKVPLTGKFADAPQEFRNLYGFDSQHISTTATFAVGVAYYKRTTTRVGDHLFLTDTGFDPDTDPKSATAAGTGTIEQFAAANPSQLVLSLGTTKTVKGARCWVHNTENASSGATTTSNTFSVNPSFRSYCEIAGKVYAATLQPDGAQLGTVYPTVGANGVATVVRAPFNVRLNKAAADSIRQMIF